MTTNSSSGETVHTPSADVLARSADAAYAQMKAVRAAEVPAEMYARQTRNAVRFIAWLLGIVFLLAVTGGIITAVQLSHGIGGSGGGTSICQSLGGTDPSC